MSRSSSPPRLSIRDAHKSYGGTPALINAALDLLPGEVHALMGENGAGKSTLIKILAGVVTPDQAHIEVDGEAVRLYSAADSFAHGLRFIHQELNVVPQLSVAENLFLSQSYPRIGGVFVHWRALYAAAREALSSLGITHIDPRLPIGRLNTGDQMLVKIASAFAVSKKHTPSIYVMDEPTAALTGDETARLFRVIAELKAQDCAILYVSHRLDEIFQIADRVTVMRDGCVVATQAITVTSAAELVRLMTGREMTGVYPPRARSTADHAESVLQVRDLSTAHLRRADFHLRAGEILGVAGLTGSGRSELLRALVGADRLTGGEIILGSDAADTSRGAGTTLRGVRSKWNSKSRITPASAWRCGICYIPEERRTQGLILSRSIRDNVTMPHLTTMSGAGVLLNRRREESAARATGESVRLKARHPRQIARQLSGGNQQKTLFARALVGSAHVLLLDEPTRGVDIGAKYDLYALIRELTAQGVGVIMASSDHAELIGMCDRILIMRDRKQAAILDASGLTETALLAACYGHGDSN